MIRPRRSASVSEHRFNQNKVAGTVDSGLHARPGSFGILQQARVMAPEDRMRITDLKQHWFIRAEDNCGRLDPQKIERALTFAYCQHATTAAIAAIHEVEIDHWQQRLPLNGGFSRERQGQITHVDAHRGILSQRQ